MEDVLIKILQSEELDLAKIIVILLIFLFVMIKQRKTEEKIEIISSNHLHEINNTLERVERKIEEGFKEVNSNIKDLGEKVLIIKTYQETKNKK
ncbi:MAG: hypothetical protein N2Z85_01655 [Patescibacteria group bacterium]|nr:hypothetical protein [Patescibacteria group bacterium]